MRYISEAINFEVIRWFALRAKAAYDQEAQIKAVFPDTIRVSIVPGTDVQYFLEFDPKAGEQIISIRGTDNLQNFKQDAEYIPSKNKQSHIYVHSGFDADTYKVYLDILPFLRKELRVKLTGHSLGAAISTLLMIYLHADGFDIARSINFGQPKLTNKDGVNRYEFLPLTRVVDENDVVPLLPPVTLLDSLHGLYEHLGDEIILLEGLIMRILNSMMRKENRSGASGKISVRKASANIIWLIISKTWMANWLVPYRFLMHSGKPISINRLNSHY